MFRTARQNRVYQDIVDQIQQAILSGKLKIGDMLPPERELKEVFQTSRGTLREALRVLEEKGLIEIKLGTGGGAVVRDATTEQMSETLAFLIRFEKVSLDQLAEFREGVEGNVMALAAERARPADIVELRELLTKAQQQVDAGVEEWEAFIEVDKQLHQKVAQISDNPIYVFVFKTVHDNIHQYYERFLPEDEALMQENYKDLCNMVETIARGDSGKARDLAKTHVHRFFRYMKENEIPITEKA